MNAGNGRSDPAGRSDEQNSGRKDEASRKKTAPMRRRHEKIRELIQGRGFVTIESLSQAFNVTPPDDSA